MDTKQIQALDKQHVIYPWVQQAATDRVVMERADGIYLWNTEGKRYIDFCAGLLCVNVGHNHPHVKNAIKEQLDKLCYAPPIFATEPKSRLAQMISEVTPGDLNHVFFTNAGAEAIENAIKAARWATGRHKVYSRWRSYHGATAGAITLSGDPRRWPAEPGIPGAFKFFGPYCYRCPFGYEGESSCSQQCLETLKTQVMLEGPKTIAAIFIEPITGTSCIIPPPKFFVQGVRKLCDDHGILLVVDEVMAGWGRSGKWFGIDHYDVVPDIMVMAKGLTSGYVQLGAMVWGDRLQDHFSKNPFTGGLTYQGHALACAAGIANIEVYREEGLIEKSASNGAYLHERLTALMDKHPSIGEVRSRGLWACVELTRDRANRTPLADFGDARGNVMKELTSRLYGNGLFLFAKWDYIFIAPPLNITRDQIDEAVAILDDGLNYTDSLL